MDYLKSNLNKINGTELSREIRILLEKNLMHLPKEKRIPLYFNVLIQVLNNAILEFCQSGKEKYFKDKIIELLNKDFSLASIRKLKLDE